MAWTYSDFKAYRNIPDNQDAIAQKAFDEANALVTALIGDSTHTDLSTTGISRYQMLMIAADEIWGQRNAPNGISQFATFDGTQPVRVARDPLTGCYPIINRYRRMGLG